MYFEYFYGNGQPKIIISVFAQLVYQLILKVYATTELNFSQLKVEFLNGKRKKTEEPMHPIKMLSMLKNDLFVLLHDHVPEALT